MHYAQLHFKEEFAVKAGNARSQAAVMVLQAGESTGGSDNRHKGADQWLYVVSGKGLAMIDGKENRLTVGSLVLIERGEVHEICNTGSAPLQTLNFYLPPAYDENGEPLPAGKSE